jgi:TolB protein
MAGQPQLENQQEPGTEKPDTLTDPQESQARRRGCRSPVWLWLLLGGLAVLLVLLAAVGLAALGVYDGLKDRALANRDLAEEHYALGVAHLESGEYELAVAELEVAQRYDPNLPGLLDQLRTAKELARAQITPTSQTRRDAAALLYHQAVPYYESGNLAQAVSLLEELRELDAEYQRENVETMLARAHHQLGLITVQEDRLEEAKAHFEAVLALKPDDQAAQEQLNLLSFYTAALNHWQQDWSAAIQGLKGLYALAPDYKDVRMRLHDAYIFFGQELIDKGDWCEAAEQYSAAVGVLPLEESVDKRDDARLKCQATAEAPAVAPTRQGAAQATAGTGASPQITATPRSASAAAGGGRIAFTRYDATRQRYDLYELDLARGEVRLLREKASQPAFSPDGRRLAFHNHDSSHLGLGILDLVTNQVSDLTPHVEDTMPAWLPSLDQIVFASDKHGDRKWRVYVISPGQVRGEGEEWALGQMPTWSPDARRVAYHGCDIRGDNCGVRVMKAGGFDPGRLSTDPSDTAPSWSPDGSQVAFISARPGNWELYLVDVATGQETRLTNHPAADVAPAWSPDGRRLAFLSNRDGGWALYALEVGSGQVTRLAGAGDPYPDAVTARISWVR